MFTFFSFLMQESFVGYNSCFDRITCWSGPDKPCGPRLCCSCHLLNHMCCGLLLLLCHGLWSYSQHPLLWDFSNSCTRCVHSDMLPHLLVLRYHCYLQPSRDAEHYWSCWGVWDLCYRLCHSIGICLPQDSWNKRHAPWSHHRVLQCWIQASRQNLNERWKLHWQKHPGEEVHK